MSAAPLYLIGPNLMEGGRAAGWLTLLYHLLKARENIVLVTPRGAAPVSVPASAPEGAAASTTENTSENTSANKSENTSANKSEIALTNPRTNPLAAKLVRFADLAYDTDFPQARRLYCVDNSAASAAILSLGEQAPGQILSVDSHLYDPAFVPTLGMDELASVVTHAADLIGEDAALSLAHGVRRRRVSRHLQPLVGSTAVCTAPLWRGLLSPDFSNWFTAQPWPEGAHEALPHKTTPATAAVVIHMPYPADPMALAILDNFAAEPDQACVWREGLDNPMLALSQARAVIDLTPPHAPAPSALAAAAHLKGIPIIARPGLWSPPLKASLIKVPAHPDPRDYSLRAAGAAQEDTDMSRVVRAADAPSLAVCDPKVPAKLTGRSLDSALRALEGMSKTSARPIADRSVENYHILGLAPPNRWLAPKNKATRQKRFATLRTAALLAKASDLSPLVALDRFGYESIIIADQNLPSEAMKFARKQGLRLMPTEKLRPLLKAQQPFLSLDAYTRADVQCGENTLGNPDPVPIKVPEALFKEEPAIRLAGEGLVMWRSASDYSLTLILPVGFKGHCRIGLTGLPRMTITSPLGPQMLARGEHADIPVPETGILRVDLGFPRGGQNSLDAQNLWSIRKGLTRPFATYDLIPAKELRHA